MTIDDAKKINDAKGVKGKLLLHVCCAPCACGVLDTLDQFDTTLYFYNPNIMPREEYDKRLAALKRLLLSYPDVGLIAEEYSPDDFIEVARGCEECPEGGERCAQCFRLRLAVTAAYAAAHRDKFDCFATTLTLSPHKNAKLINSLGVAAAEEYGAVYLESDFKKKDGFLNSIKLAKQLGIYRQNYCGCVWSATKTE